MAARVTTLNLPDGRCLRLDDALAGRVCAAVVALAGVAVRPEPAVWAETAQLAERLRAEHAGKLPSQIPGLQEARDLYKSFGMDPSRHRPSSEALLRRVLQGKDLYRLDSAVDCCNLASLSYLLPIGLYDLARIDGDITLRAGEAGEQYAGIRKGPVNLAGRLALFDAQGGFGSPTSDSARTSVTAATTDILALIMATAAYPAARLQAHRRHLADLYTRHCRAQVTLAAELGVPDAA
jgi:DNA/RNA-binding domain of Phe-tRNA-synthetase-like protein